MHHGQQGSGQLHSGLGQGVGLDILFSLVGLSSPNTIADG
jgi:hypothetical protein